jgi:hypothetical protein
MDIMQQVKEVKVLEMKPDAMGIPRRISAEARIESGLLKLNIKVKGSGPLNYVLRVDGNLHYSEGETPRKIPSANMPYDRIGPEEKRMEEVEAAIKRWYNNHSTWFDSLLRRQQ